MAPTLTLNVSPPGGGGSYPAATAYGTPTHPQYQDIGGDGVSVPPNGFNQSNVYMLETDANGDIVFEPGPQTRVFYFTAGGNGFTRAEIAAVEGEAVGTITDAWIAGQTRWGGTEAEPLDWSDFGYGPFNEWTNSNANAGAWVLLERGHEYPGTIPPFPRNDGYSALHPVVYGAWGTGNRPHIPTLTTWTMGGGGGSHRHVAFSDWELRPFYALVFNFDNLIFSNVLAERSYADGSKPEFALQAVPAAADSRYDGVTFYQCRLYDLSFPSPPSGSWNNDERTSGVYMERTDNALVYKSHFDRNGWGVGYDLGNDTTSPQWPTIYNHNYYMQYDCGPCLYRESIFARGSLSGVQARSGGRFLRNLFSENNVAHQIFHNGTEGNSGAFYPLNEATVVTLLGSVYTGGGDKTLGLSGSGQGWGPQEQSDDWVALDVIVANGADPNNAAEVSSKAGVSGADPVASGVAHFEEMTYVDWFQQPDENASGILQADREAMTIGRFVDDQQSVAAGTNTTETALDWLRTQARPWNLLGEIYDWFAVRAGIRRFVRSTATHVTFQPWQVADGFVWENYMNWSSRDIPGTDVAGDHVSIAGWTVHTYESNADLAEIHMASGALFIYGGKTKADNLAGSGTITCNRVGKLYIGGATSGAKDVIVNGGRCAFTGNLSNFVSFTINSDSENPPEFVVRSGQSVTIGAAETLTLNGPNLRAILDGIDGGAATLTIAGTLAFVAGSGAVPSIREGRSGIYGLNPATNQPYDPNVASTVVLEAGSTVTVDTTGLPSGTYTLIDVDTLTDNGATLPAGVAVNGNRLEVTVP